MSAIELKSLIDKYKKNEDYDFTGYLMYRDNIVAEIKDSKIDNILNKELLPIIMLDETEGAFENWLQTRVIDTHRTNSRQVRRRLSVRSEIPKEIVIKARAVSVTDGYWLKYKDEEINYNDIRNKLSDGLNTVALYGNVEEIVFNEDNITPELTNIGSFEKCWRLINNKWHMIKKGSYKENFAEVLTSRISIYLGFKAIEYKPLEGGKLVICEDFTNSAEFDFEPMYSFVRDYWEVENSIKIIEQLGFINEFLDITFIDALCYNIDRHTFNFGFLRQNGNIIGLAPNFDNNLALSGVLKDKALEKTWYSTSFTRHNYLPILKEYNYKVPKVNFDDINKIIKNTIEEFPNLKGEEGFSDIVLKILQNNYNELNK